MPFNADDYTKAPFGSGIMFDPATEETEILYVQSELKEIAEEQGVSILVDEVIYAYNSYPDRWDKGEWINGDTAEFCWAYQPVEEVIEEESTELPAEEPTEEEPV
ncbi:hypothetical protein [Peribacillus asahii]|uniref:hypothetical protein n=1 Tax=Peribacillus asahii TaxID=228899 RepID=UPI0037F8EC59